ncbi:glycosyltransferase [Oceanotoga sp. DSM 15011]|uniref:glycosyltransferase n=1 Tax=Oceanotoga TaxID=1255275 RepID=UPI0021F44D4A|nr:MULTISPECIES: glycosyltransferase [Oceanotoga]MDO7977846.1 glycosyltransferase [Oceanotoga teriensis]UYP00729.1 glycosyltransferase [Oceanotoga sp. DSM 15011]
MNIGMFSDTYIPQKNGVATAVKIYKEEMEKMGHNVYLFVPQYKFEHKRNEKNVFEFPAVRYFKEKEQRIALPISKHLFNIKKLDLDVLHSHAPFSTGIMARIISSNLDIKHVGTHHTMYEFYRHYVPLIIRPSLEQTQNMIKNWCLKLNKVIAPTENIKNVLVDYGVPSDHIRVIPTGIDVDKFQSDIKWNIRENFNIQEDDRVLLFVGRVAKEKNIDFLIKMFKKLTYEESNLKFLIIGDGVERQNLEEIVVENKLQQKVFFAGAQPREKVIDAYKQADIFTFASYTETQGLVVLESMAAGTPVVALGKMGVYDLLSQPETGGIMIDELVEDDFIHEILKLLRDKKLYEDYSKKGIDFVRKNYSVKVNVENIIKVYEEVINF